MARGEWGTPAGAFIFIHVVREGWGIIKIKTACRRRRQTEAVCLKDPPCQIMFLYIHFSCYATTNMVPNQLPTIWQLFCLHTWRGFLNSWHVQSCGGHLTVYGMIKACHVLSGGGGDAVNLSTWVPDLQTWSPSSSVDATAQSLFNQLLSYGLI